MMHTMERYFIPESQCEMTDESAEGLLRTVIKNGPKVLENPSDYNAMAEIMWCGSLSHNGLTECGRGKDFSVHKFGHALSAKYDVAHGASLAAVWVPGRNTSTMRRRFSGGLHGLQKKSGASQREAITNGQRKALSAQ